jgi:glycosyltransferase involved in cell wall biosynthesis
MLSNFYPPVRSGGYTQLCQEVATGLQARGHTIGVITSCHELGKSRIREENVYRVLHLDGDLNYYRPKTFFTRWLRQQRENLHNLRMVLSKFRPDILVVWDMWALSHSVPALGAALMSGRTVYYLAGYWPIANDMHTTYWNLPPRRLYMRWPKRILRRVALGLLARQANTDLRLEHSICVSAALRDNLVAGGLHMRDARVIHCGTDPERFAQPIARDFSRRPLRLLCAGRLSEQKGVHTAVEASATLAKWGHAGRVTLTVMGSGHPEYESRVRDLVTQGNLEEHVDFLAPVSKDRFPDILSKFDILIFPSIYGEPFARTPLEAMLAGMVVVGTPTGGTNEILQDGRNALTFAAEDAEGLARQVLELLNDPELCQKLSVNGRETVLGQFTLPDMIAKVEEYLLEVSHAA